MIANDLLQVDLREVNEFTVCAYLKLGNPARIQATRGGVLRCLIPLRGPKKRKLDFNAKEKETSSGASSPGPGGKLPQGLMQKQIDILVDELLELRKEIAEKTGVKAFSIIATPNLRKMADVISMPKPITVKSFIELEGWGHVKAAKFGWEFFKKLKDWRSRLRGDCTQATEDDKLEFSKLSKDALPKKKATDPHIIQTTTPPHTPTKPQPFTPQAFKPLQTPPSASKPPTPAAKVAPNPTYDILSDDYCGAEDMHIDEAAYAEAFNNFNPPSDTEGPTPKRARPNPFKQYNNNTP
eukprot:TRINITY_DN4506_c0_g1_i1.p1 TRINITY_DN4506_c0_g1~~TRINITY_DN4506_c0_g1_i1.p1  ORF type:complete len:296 (+),score=89.14 TRINITY_DN4506_c0_g1_i1:39-926(+)